MDMMEVRRRVMLSMGKTKMPRSVRAFGPCVCENKTLVFQFDAPRQGFFMIIADPPIRQEEAVQLQTDVSFGMYNGEIYQSRIVSIPQDGVTYSYRNQTFNKSGALDSWGSYTKYTFSGDTLTVTDRFLINGRSYYLITVQSAELIN